MTMDCGEARTGLWPPERPRLVGQNVAAARDHVRECETCRAYFEQDRALLDLYDRARATRAPMTARERVFDALAAARWDTRSRRGWSGPAVGSRAQGGAWTSRAQRLFDTKSWRSGFLPAAAAALFASVIAIGVWSGDQQSIESSDMFVEDYLRRAVGQDHIETSDPVAVTRFLERELGVHVEPIRFAGLDITRAEICLLEGRRGAMIVYERDGAEVAHYLVPRDNATVRSPALSRSRGATTAEMPVVTWATPRVEQALVGEVTSMALLEIAAHASSDY